MHRLLRALLGAILLLGIVAVAAGAAIALGVDRPTVERADSHVVSVNATTTLVETDITISNPNPIGIRLGDATVTHAVRMNGIEVGTGTKQGLRITADTTHVTLTTAIDNREIPAWWVRHIERGERTRVETSVGVSVPVLGRIASHDETTTLRTNVTERLNSSTSRPVNASLPLVSDPVLVVDRTRASWGETTRERTPLDARITVENPTSIPFTIARLDYTVTMNSVTVGNGTTGRSTTIPAGGQRTIQTAAAIRTERLDDWWVSHIGRGQHTTLRVAFTGVVTLPNGDTVRVPLDDFDYTATIDTHLLEAGGATEPDVKNEPGRDAPSERSEHKSAVGPKPMA